MNRALSKAEPLFGQTFDQSHGEVTRESYPKPTKGTRQVDTELAVGRTGINCQAPAIIQRIYTSSGMAVVLGGSLTRFHQLRNCVAAFRGPQIVQGKSGKEAHSIGRASKRWVSKVKTDSTHPPPGLFTKDAATIARTLRSRRVSPKGPTSGLRMLTYFINRAGKGLSRTRRAELERAKHLLSAGNRSFHRSTSGKHSRLKKK